MNDSNAARMTSLVIAAILGALTCYALSRRGSRDDLSAPPSPTRPPLHPPTSTSLPPQESPPPPPPDDATAALVQSLQAELAREKAAGAVERSARTARERAKRHDIVASQISTGFHMVPIGHVETPFRDRRGTPRQPSLAPAAVGRIVFDRKLIQAEHFAELAQFSHVWVIFVFHNNTNAVSPSRGGRHIGGSNSKSSSSCDPAPTPTAKIRPPRLFGQKVGCLSTRSPHRPNPIGLSACEVVSVTSNNITIRGIDFVDMTPVLDVKPYIPYDLVPSLLPLPMAVYCSPSPDPSPSPNSNNDADHDWSLSRGHSPTPNPTTLRVPSWIYEADVPVRLVRFSVPAADQLQAMLGGTRGGGGGMCEDRGRDRGRGRGRAGEFSGGVEGAKALIEQVLRQDIRGVRQGRGGRDDDGGMQMGGDGPGAGAKAGARGGAELGGGGSPFMVHLDGMSVDFRTWRGEIVVTRVSEG